jgi:hypothetical protein
MSASYEPDFSQDLFWVRFKIGDTNPVSASVQDEEILDLLSEKPNRYLAAAEAAEVVLSRMKGLTSKTVGDLSLSFGGGSESDYRSLIMRLRQHGTQLAMGASHLLKAH